MNISHTLPSEQLWGFGLIVIGDIYAYYSALPPDRMEESMISLHASYSYELSFSDFSARFIKFFVSVSINTLADHIQLNEGSLGFIFY